LSVSELLNLYLLQCASSSCVNITMLQIFSAYRYLYLQICTSSLCLSCPPCDVPQVRRQARLQRFQEASTGSSGGGSSSSGAKQEALRLVDQRESGGFGTSTALEKEYLRLTSLPLASEVRPPEVGWGRTRGCKHFFGSDRVKWGRTGVGRIRYNATGTEIAAIKGGLGQRQGLQPLC
jgi:hypothetical protein